MPPRRVAAVIALALTAIAGASLASVRIPLEVPGIPGGSLVKGFDDRFEVLTVSLGYSTPTAGQLTLTPVTITNNVDRGSPASMQAGAQGVSFELEVGAAVRKPLGTIVVRTLLSATSTGRPSPQRNRTDVRLYDARITDYRLLDDEGTPTGVEQFTCVVSGYDMTVTPNGGTALPPGPVGETASGGK